MKPDRLSASGAVITDRARWHFRETKEENKALYRQLKGEFGSVSSSVSE